MTGRKAGKQVRKGTGKQVQPAHQRSQPPDETPTPPNIRREQPPQPQVVKKIMKVDNDEARTLKTVFKSNPDTQMKDFIKRAAIKPGGANIPAAKVAQKTPAENHPQAVAQELLETDDDVADNLGKLFKASKSFKNV